MNEHETIHTLVTNTELCSVLDHNPKATIATRGFFTNYPIDDLAIKNDCALIFGRSDHLWIHCVGEEQDDLEDLLHHHRDRSPYYYSLEEWMLPIVLKGRNEEWRMETLRYILEPNVQVPLPKNETQVLSPLFSSYVFEHSNYREFTNEDYIRDRLLHDISAAIIKNGKPIAWGFTHDDGALGFLHVLPEYRKKGYARDIVLARIIQKRQLGLPVFCNIVPDNFAAIHLMEQIGFQFDRKTVWLKLQEHTHATL